MDFLYDGWFEGFEGISFEGVDLCSTWNGWACPAFTKEVSDEIMRVINAIGNVDNRMEFVDSENGGYYVSYDGDFDNGDRFDPIIINGIWHYPIGAYCWIWEKVE